MLRRYWSKKHLDLNTPRSPEIGDVFYCPYVWDWQRLRVSQKDRPCCVAVRLRSKKHDVLSGENWNVALLAITKDPDERNNVKIEIPPEEISRIKKFKETDIRYLVVSENNITLDDQPFFNEYEYRGSFSKDFMKKVVYPEIRKMFL